MRKGGGSGFFCHVVYSTWTPTSIARPDSRTYSPRAVRATSRTSARPATVSRGRSSIGASQARQRMVGTEANANPWEVLRKIRDGHSGHEMVALRPFPMDVSVDILTYIRTLQQK